jgi:NAD(P)-dependent dehydrogenase (short-subunit alcohol dehydrogenase family)
MVERVKSMKKGDGDMKKTALVTGAYGAIGKAIARNIAATGDYRVSLVVRDGMKGQHVVDEIISRTGNEDIFLETVDLSREASVKSLSDRWDGPIHLLINNAAATPRERQETPEGIEMQWATNVLGYFWMIKYLEPYLEQGSPSRVVNVASYWAGNLDFDDLEFKWRQYDNDQAYLQSKQADRMLTVAFANRLKGKGITVNACHPGDVSSKLSNNLGYGGHESPDQGADTPVWLGISDEMGGITGRYYEGRREVGCRFGGDLDGVERLYGVCGG